MLYLSDGQQIAIRLSRQITKVTNKMKLTIEKWNAATDSLRDFIDGLPERMTFDNVNDPTSELFSDLDPNEDRDAVDASLEIPMYTKRKAIDLHLFWKRCEEEEQLLGVEKDRLLSYYTNTCHNIDQELANIGDLNGSRLRFSLGSRHELLRMRTKLQNELFHLKKLLGLPPGETVLMQAELWHSFKDDEESLIDSEDTTGYTDDQSEDEEAVEELSDIDSDFE